MHHPETGRKFLFISALKAREIVAMKRAESRAALNFLIAHPTRPEFQCRFRWAPNSLALWDTIQLCTAVFLILGRATG